MKKRVLNKNVVNKINIAKKDLIETVVINQVGKKIYKINKKYKLVIHYYKLINLVIQIYVNNKLISSERYIDNQWKQIE